MTRDRPRRLPDMDCLFCSIAAGEASSYVVHEDDDFVGFLDVRTVFKGHVLLIPRQHIATLPDLPVDLQAAFVALQQRLCLAVTSGLGAGGTFVAINNTVSQSVPHLHCHVVPRTKGDGLRGFFWPRTKYVDGDEATSYARRLRAALE